MKAADWIAMAITIPLIIGFLSVAVYSVILQRKATKSALPRTLELQEQEVKLAEETVRLQQEAIALLRDINQKLDRDQRS
jgi:uncharacterized protein HemX